MSASRVISVLFVVLLEVFGGPLAGQQRDFGRVRIKVEHEGGPIEGAQVSAGPIGGLTNSAGRVELSLPTGGVSIRVERIGYRARNVTIAVRAGELVEQVVTLEEEAIQEEEIVVLSTRVDRRIEDEPLRVEVLPREEVEEKLMMTPGDIAMLLNETAGLRVQPTAPSLGGATVRVQGLRGRYTQLLSDGLPLYGGQTGALGPLQIPPLDLGQVEVIKGVASALYGSSALGGVVNLISRRPGDRPDSEILVNRTSLDGTDLILWDSRAVGPRTAYTVLASGHRQGKGDVDEDGWADLPSFTRFTARPRFFWSDGAGSTAFLTVGGMTEKREGGTLAGRTTPTGEHYAESLETKRMDGGGVARLLVAADHLLSARASASVQHHVHRFGADTEEDAHRTLFGEVTTSWNRGRHALLAGAALQLDGYDARTLSGFDYTYTVPGLFVQEEFRASDWLTLSGSARVDRHSAFGTFVNPRLSALAHPSGWTIRASGGTGYFAPTPWTEETEATGLARLSPLRGVDAERARSAMFDVGRRYGPFELNGTLFGSTIRHPLQLRAVPAAEGRFHFVNAQGDVRTWGTEFLAQFARAGIHVTGTHVYLRSTEPSPELGGRREVPLTPRHAVGLVAAWEQEERGRVGVEFYFTGRQRLEHNPYRTRSDPYSVVGFLVERRLGPVRAFVNAENLLDARQTREDPLTLPSRAEDGRWTTDVWGSLEGRTFNAGLRWTLGGQPAP